MSKIVYFLYKLSRTLYQLKIPLLPKIIQGMIRIMFGCSIPYLAEIGKNTVLSYGGIGVVIHKRCKIGSNCYIGPGTVIGGTNHKYKVADIGDKVYIGTGAKIIGPIKIGNNVVIGANAVVVDDVPANSVVAGIPARVIKQDIDIREYASL